ncbi:hypothetical protein RHSIM_RhsimUnG0146000 [Rhododendron simsii]|uniref:Uncharacterized protein n=1 Tax=Rhododendron simsii TaxID=118357 RepID=A0A834L437_RHOSS|nr:hypothetical protein RHSIM_RhsimUnG0146000 [Rhododendron simsii]
MEGSKPMSTPMSTSMKLDSDENGKLVNEKMYRGLFYPCGVAFDLVDYSDADFGGFKVDRKSIMSNIVYPKLIWYFYCNLDVDRNADEYTLVSRVKEVDFVLDVSTMSRFLKCLVVERYQYVANDEELINAIDDVSAF